MALRTDPVSSAAFASLARPASADAVRPSALLWASEMPFGAASRSNETLEEADQARALEVVSSTGWFSAVRSAEQDNSGDVRLEARYEFLGESESFLLLASVVTLGVIPSRSSGVIALHLRVSDAAGNVRGEITRAERYTRWDGWLFLPLAPFLPEGDVRRDVHDDLLRAALAEARLDGWL